MKKILILSLFVCSLAAINKPVMAIYEINNLDVPVMLEAVKAALARNNSGIDKNHFATELQKMSKSGTVTVRTVMVACLRSSPNYDPNKPVSDCNKFVMDVIKEHNTRIGNKNNSIAKSVMNSMKPYGTKTYSSDGKYYMASCAGVYMNQFSGCVFTNKTNRFVCAFPATRELAQTCVNNDLPNTTFVAVWNGYDLESGLYIVDTTDNRTLINPILGEIVELTGFPPTNIQAYFTKYAQNSYLSKSNLQDYAINCSETVDKMPQKISQLPLMQKYKYINQENVEELQRIRSSLFTALDRLQNLSPQDRITADCETVTDENYNYIKNRIETFNRVEKLGINLDGYSTLVYSGKYTKEAEKLFKELKSTTANYGSLVTPKNADAAYKISKQIIHDMIWNGNFGDVGDSGKRSKLWPLTFWQEAEFLDNDEFTCKIHCDNGAQYTQNHALVMTPTTTVRCYSKVENMLQLPNITIELTFGGNLCPKK